VRADRLLSLVLLLQSRGGATARALAAELDVSVRTIYRDLEALGAAGVPVVTESGPGGGCRLMDGYRFPLRGLQPDEAEALLILGVPEALRELGLDRALGAAHRQIRVTAGLGGEAPRSASDAGGALVYLDLPRWFSSQEDVPCLRILAQALRRGRMLRFRYAHQDGRAHEPRTVGPLGLVNKAGSWYLVAVTAIGEPRQAGDQRVFRAGRISSALVLAEPFPRPPGFDLAGFWARWSAEFAASRPRLQVTLRASPEALAVFPEIFGQAAGAALEAALPPDPAGWRVVTLSFEHELAAAYRLAGFGDQVEVLTPLPVRTRLIAIAYELLGRYRDDHRPLAAGGRCATRIRTPAWMIRPGRTTACSAPGR
jgi:predicted DNA-binding transcriptional regulator YafY